MKSLKQKYVIKAEASKVWSALVEPTEIKNWGAGPAKMKDAEGFKFSLWGGDIWGTNTKVVNKKLLEQDWYAAPGISLQK